MLVLPLLLIGCSNEAAVVEENVAKIEEDEENVETTIIKWNSYENERFGFTINYPAHWEIGEESQNGDGITLYSGDPENEIIIYGQLYDEDLTDPFEDANKEGFTRGMITLNSGDDADYIVGLEDGKVHFKVIRIIGWEMYTYYAMMTPDFFDENLDELLETIKTLKIDPIP